MNKIKGPSKEQIELLKGIGVLLLLLVTFILMIFLNACMAGGF